MQKGFHSRKIFVLLAAALLFVSATPMAAELTPANVAGTWNFKVQGDAGAADQVIVFTQDGDKLTGTFKGPKQTGSIDGVMDGPRIKFHVTARFPINYVGTVTGETMSGTLTAQGKNGTFTAHRVKPA
jgi:opacity protein-like surface antigen